jgi:hypothetical protein
MPQDLVLTKKAPTFALAIGIQKRLALDFK